MAMPKALIRASCNLSPPWRLDGSGKQYWDGSFLRFALIGNGVQESGREECGEFPEVEADGKVICPRGFGHDCGARQFSERYFSDRIPNPQGARRRVCGLLRPRAIDAHIHLYQDNPAFGDVMQRLNLRALNICVIDDRDPFYKGLEPQHGDALKVRQSNRRPRGSVYHFQLLRFRRAGIRREGDPPTRCRLHGRSYRRENLQGHGHGDEIESGEICDAG